MSVTETTTDADARYRLVGLPDGWVEPQVQTVDQDGGRTWFPIGKGGVVKWLWRTGEFDRHAMSVEQANEAIAYVKDRYGLGRDAEVELMPYRPGVVTVRELIEQLKKLDPDAAAVVYDGLGIPCPPKLEPIAHDGYTHYRQGSAFAVVADFEASQRVGREAIPEPAVPLYDPALVARVTETGRSITHGLGLGVRVGGDVVIFTEPDGKTNFGGPEGQE